MTTGLNLTDPPAPDRVRVMFADQLNIARGKYIPLRLAEKGYVRISTGVYGVTYKRELTPAPGAAVQEGLPNLDATFDPAGLRPGWEVNTKIALCDLKQRGAPFALCGRTALKRAIADWEALGCTPMVGIELEAYVFERGLKGEWVPYENPGSAYYGAGALADPAGLMDLIWAQAAACGLNIESMHSEFDWPQFEMTLQFSDALSAADDTFLFRQMAREVLFKRGYLLCFLAKPIDGRSGCGMHINLSLRNSEGANLFSHNGTFKLPTVTGECIAGLLKHHEGLAALLAPTVNSYDRLVPASFCGYWANWGMDHRSVSIRVSAEDGDGARIEHRVADGAASPYVAIAAVLQAARLGVVGKLAPPAPERHDGLETVNTDRHTPNSLAKALLALESDTALTRAVGKALVDNFLAVKRVEITELDGRPPREIFAYYSPFI